MMELLQAGNPELTEDDVRFGIRRARQVFEKHGEPSALRLTDFQLAAILADVHREAKGRTMKLSPGENNEAKD